MSQIKKTDLRVGVRLYRNGERNEVFTIRSIDARKGLARAGFEAELYLHYGSGEKVRWRTVAEIRSRYTLLG